MGLLGPILEGMRDAEGRPVHTHQLDTGNGVTHVSHNDPPPVTPGAGLNVTDSVVSVNTSGDDNDRSFVLFQRFDLNGAKYVSAFGYSRGNMIPEGYMPNGNGRVLVDGGVISDNVIPTGPVNAVWTTD